MHRLFFSRTATLRSRPVLASVLWLVLPRPYHESKPTEEETQDTATEQAKY